MDGYEIHDYIYVIIGDEPIVNILLTDNTDFKRQITSRLNTWGFRETDSLDLSDVTWHNIRHGRLVGITVLTHDYSDGNTEAIRYGVCPCSALQDIRKTILGLWC